jgi:hypothetical protein
MSRPAAWRTLCVVAALTTLAATTAFALTYHRNAWSEDFPRYACIHRGSLIMLSSVWEWPPPAVRAGQYSWSYDVFLAAPPRWRPSFVRVGNRYAIGPVRWGRPMLGTVVPLWTIAGAAACVAAIAWRPSRWTRRADACPKCNYSRAGLQPAQHCPECGTTATDSPP